MDKIRSDLRLVLRRLRRSPGFTIAAMLTLAFGIGASTTMFSIVNGVLLRPLPYADPGRVVTIGDQVEGLDWGYTDPGWVSAYDVVVYARETRSFESLGGSVSVKYELSGVGQPAQVMGSRMTPGVFSALGVQPFLGRVFTTQEDEQKERVAILSYATWANRFNAAPQIVGTKIQLDRKPYTIIGVMPKGFEYPLFRGRRDRMELWVPMSFAPDELLPEQYAYWNMHMIGRLKPGVTIEQAQADLRRGAQQIMHDYPPDEANFHIRPVVYPLQQISVVRMRPMLRMFSLAVAVVLLTACANLAGLLLVRAIRSQREVALRRALGAPALTLLRETMLESVVLCVAGGLLGFGVATAALAAGKDYLPDAVVLTNQISLNWVVVGFALALAVLTGLACGVAPGLAALRINVSESLKEGGRSGSASASHARLRSAIVVAEIAITLVLLSASGLLLRSYSNLNAVDLGFRPDHVTTAAYTLPQKQQGAIDVFNARLLDQLRQMPSVKSAGLTNALPTTGGALASFVVEGYVDPRGPDRTSAYPIAIIGDYFDALGIALLRGRQFNESDNGTGSQLVVIVNHEFAQHYWPGQDPIGKRIRNGALKSDTPWMTIIGEVADAKLHGPDEDATEQFYQPVAQIERSLGVFAQPTDLNGNDGFIVVRSAVQPKQMENVLRTTVRTLDPQLPLTDVESMEEVVSRSAAPRRLNAIVVSGFALAAALLAVLGIYSIIAFSVAARVQEIAIRLTLGSRRSAIVRLVVVSGLRLALVGCVLGLAGAAATSSILRTFLFNVSPFDPLVTILTTIAIFALALASSALPAGRAAAVNPIRALRGE